MREVYGTPNMLSSYQNKKQQLKGRWHYERICYGKRLYGAGGGKVYFVRQRGGVLGIFGGLYCLRRERPGRAHTFFLKENGKCASIKKPEDSVN